MKDDWRREQMQTTKKLIKSEETSKQKTGTDTHKEGN
jgi:hypothetical protein